MLSSSLDKKSGRMTQDDALPLRAICYKSAMLSSSLDKKSGRMTQDDALPLRVICYKNYLL